MNEAQLIARVRELFSQRIGDDAAVVDDQVWTVDMLVEDVDFTRAIPLPSIARKSLAVNLSDLAAMGAKPTHALLALALPPWALESVDELLVAYAESAKHYGIEIVGGDFSRAEKLTISITAVGRLVVRPLSRSGARPGDWIYLSRVVGGSAAGLAMLAKGQPLGDALHWHLDPKPEISLGMTLAQVPEVTSCIDVSDGLSTDLHHLCDASNVGAEIEWERIPIAPGVENRDFVLHGGEEYALLFTASLPELELTRILGRTLHAIGRITSRRGVILKEAGVSGPLEPRGFDHFA